MTRWQCRTVPFKYQLSDITLLSLPIRLQVRSERLAADTPPVGILEVPEDALDEGSQGFLVRGLPLAGEQPSIRPVGRYLCYVPKQYQHCYIDLSQTFEEYKAKFSSKTRSTINRKIKKFAEHCGGELKWKTYKTPEEISEYIGLARAVSKLTYQERLLDAGLPESETFIRNALAMAAEGRVRAYILFHGDRPVSYLYCPVTDGVLSYAYVGYDPEYMDKSVGLVLQWQAVEQLYSEGGFRYFDFTEGQSDHKRLFSTHQRLCANVFFIRKSLRNAMIVRSHNQMNRISESAGAWMEKAGLKAKLKRILRFGG
jgi:CelD/BcsL family acetyltransferase involved in cellulose biosynthesis